MELLEHYRAMARMRAVEMGLADLWHRGLVPGEMHLGTGEEALVAGVLANRRGGDYFAIDHRPSTVLTGLGVEPRAILGECIGDEEGLCRGRGGHMHLYAPEYRAATSGIVGSAAPAAVGFALASSLREKGGAAFAFFGDGAINQGMLLESLNLAAAWSLPVLFVCKDNGWAIATRSEKVTGGDLCARARGFGLVADEVDGTDPEAVAATTAKLLAGVRKGKPAFLRASVLRLDGHLLGDLLVRVSKDPTSEDARKTAGDLMSGLFGRKGGGVTDRARSVGSMLGLMVKARGDERDSRRDPLVQVRKKVARTHEAEVDRIDRELVDEMESIIASLTEGGDR